MNLLFLIVIPYLSFAQEGQVNISLKSNQAVIENTNCYPVVVFVNGENHSLPKKSSTTLKTRSWSKWHWMPGILGDLSEKRVLSPLKGRSKPDFGPGEGIHKDSSHFGYDFTISEGTPVYPMEGGVVIKVTNLYKSAHQDKTRLKENNQIDILHLDGSISRYSHLKKDSMKVKVCDVVETAQVIGESGNTGFSTAPHLHVDFFRPISGAEYKTLPLIFSERN